MRPACVLGHSVCVEALDPFDGQSPRKAILANHAVLEE
jgi:hypothetical protein